MCVTLVSLVMSFGGGGGGYCWLCHWGEGSVGYVIDML